MTRKYKYESYIPKYYNITTNLIDDNVKMGLGDKVALYYKEKTFTYREMQRMINRTGNALSIIGVGMNQRVLLVMYDSPEAVACFYGAIKIGAIPVPINYMYTTDDYRYLLNNSRARTLIAHEDFIEDIEGWREKFLFLQNTVVVGRKTRSFHISFYDIVDRCSDELSPAFTTLDDPVFWNYTSGSTGVPKGAVHLQNDVATCIENYAKGVLSITHDDILFSASKFFFAYGLGNSFLYPFGTGASVILLPDRPLAETIFQTITDYHPTVFFGVPTLYANMLQVKDAEKKYDLSSLRICTSAGEALPREIFEEYRRRFGIEILDGIGSTELLHIFISNRPGHARAGTSGMLVPGYSAKIVDDEGKEVQEGEVGNLLVKGDSIAAYYWRHHEKTIKSMLGEWFNTGDKYYVDNEGYYYYCGRGDDMLKVGGIWVSPIEIEDTLISHPAVLRAAVVPKKDEKELVKPKAFVELKEDFEPSEELAKEIQMFVKSSIAPYKFPRWIEFVKELPTTATGKIQRHKLRED
ncbi:MAG TPA: benzoate-CoA ligase family protein [Desulfobacteraceae bacterium]|nr:benzoate-CoA ligase family protein [Desulfobacteraceae bacterium]HPJ68353.1 benzoate-CoA ligase family protein [Desulfobacteraceae bacterium]HPQ28961.1 benzoate-CoA ligase family protein [Desulfobacteraceae bacterium]